MKKNIFFCSLSGLIFFIFSVNTLAFSQKPLPPRLIKEKKEFIDRQINKNNKEFLENLSNVFLSLNKLNKGTIDIFNTVSFPRNKTRNFVMDELRRSTKNALNSLVGKDKASGHIESFIDTWFEEDPLLKANLKDVIANYYKCQFVEEFISPISKISAAGTGTYHYYGIYLDAFTNEFGEPLHKFIKRNTVQFKNLSEKSKRKNIIELKKIISLQIDTLENAEKYLLSKIIEKMEFSNKGWSKITLTKTLELLQCQLKFDKDFLLVTLKKINSIPKPYPPRLPDLVISSLQINTPAKVKVGKRVTVLVEIKNIGQLTTDPSQVEVVFPNERTKIKNIPRLTGGQSYAFKLTYKIRKMDENIFKVTANYNDKIWELNTANNKVKRSLILLK